MKLLTTLRTTLVATLALSAVTYGTNAVAMDTFLKAKKVLPGIYYQLDQEFNQTTKTIYCGCDLSYNTKGKNVRWRLDLDSCGYEPRKNAERASRIEVEHVMAAHEFGNQLQCWRDGGRKKCTSSDKKFNKMEGDLHNLYPAVGEVNGDRGNFQFTDWNGTLTQYGKCDMVVDFKGKRAQPPKESRGMIARAHLYMAQEYGIKLSKQQRRIYDAWNQQYPADKIECRRNELIKKVQGNENSFVTDSCEIQ